MLKYLKGIVAGSGAGIKDLPYTIGEPYSSTWGSWIHHRGTNKVKMAEDGVKRVTGASPMFPILPDVSSISIPFTGSPSDATSDSGVPILDDPNLFFQQAPSHDHTSRQRVASLVHLQNRICGTPGSWDSTDWALEMSASKKHNN